MNKWVLVVTGISIPLASVAVLVCLLWLKDVRADRKHIVTTKASTPLFVGTGNEGGCSGRILTVIQQGTSLPVRRIHYLKECAALDVALPNGDQGYFVVGVGEVSVEPPLQTH